MGLENPVDPALLADMLAAREERWNRRLVLCGKARTVLSLTLCLPLPFRRESFWRSLLGQKSRELETYLTEAGIGLRGRESLSGADGDAYFFLSDADPAQLKRLCVAFEEQADGRVLDADVMSGGEAVGRSELGLPPRKCFLCGRPAAECVSRGVHDPGEVAAWVRARERCLSLNFR